jgi:hypothetical protein
MDLAQFPLEGGGSVLVEVADAAPAGPVTRGWGGTGDPRTTVQVQESFQQVIGRVGPAASAVLETLTGLSRVPDEVTVEFGVQLSAQAGAFIATLGSAANFKVTVSWQRPGG